MCYNNSLYYNIYLNKNKLKLNNKDVYLDYINNLYILKNIFKQFGKKYKYLYFDLNILLKYLNQNNIFSFKNQFLIQNKKSEVYKKIILDFFNLTHFYIIYQLSIKYVKKISYYFNNSLFLKFKYFFYKYVNFFKLNLYLYYFKKISCNLNNFFFFDKFVNKNNNILLNMGLFINRIIYKFFLFINKNLYIKGNLFLLKFNYINKNFIKNIGSLFVINKDKIFINKFFFYFKSLLINRSTFF